MTTNSELAPLRRSVASSPRSSWLVAAVTMATLLLFAGVVTVTTVRSNTRQTEAEQTARTSAVRVSITDRISAYNEMLFGVRSAFGIDGDLTHRQYHDLVLALDIDQRQLGVQVVGAAHVVEPTDRLEYERTVDERVDAADLGYPPFEIHPSPTGEEMLPVDFLEPQRGNERSFGLDLYSEANRRAAATRARDTGLPSATGPVTLVQETDAQRALLLMLPIYREGPLVDTADERRAAFDGVAYAAFRMGDLMESVLSDTGPEHVLVFDVESREILYDRAGDLDATTSSGPADGCPPLCGLPGVEDERVAEFEVAGRTWRVFVDGGPVLSPIERSFPVVTLLGGVAMAALVAGLILSMRSARHRALELATEMTRELEALTESADEAIVSIDDTGTIVAWNRGAARIFGADARRMIGRPAGDLVPEGQSGDELSKIFASVTDGPEHDQSHPTTAHSTVAVGRRADGTEFPVEVSLSQWSARGHRYLTGFMRDVTDRISAEREIVDTGNLLRGVLDSATGIAIVATDVAGTISVFNSGAERMLGYSADQLIGRSTPAIFHDPQEVEERAAELGIEPGFEVFVSVARTAQFETRQWTYITSDGARLPVELTVSPRHDHDGVLSGFIGVAIDVTEWLKADERQHDLLEQEREMVAKLTELDQVKNDFVSTISHELRTPLTSIIGYAELLADDGLDDMDPRHLDMVDIVTRNAHRLLLLVEDLLALSRIESGEMSLDREPCDLARIFEAIEVAVAPSATDRDVSVRYEIAEGAFVLGDPARLERVFLNLLSNAIKFSHAGGGVHVHVEREGDDVVARVIDHGIGIPVDEVDQLFDRFFRSRSAERHAIQGTGLGLTIVSDMVERHGGTIEVESVEDQGTTMTVRFPAHDARAAASVEPNGSGHFSTRV